jgi:3-deoxy-alpha-D-manno-octulosonate 8-oxidase
VLFLERITVLRTVLLQNIDIPTGICANLSADQYQRLYEASIIHEKPLTNALGSDFKKILTKEKVTALFRSM